MTAIERRIIVIGLVCGMAVAREAQPSFVTIEPQVTHLDGGRDASQDVFVG